MTTNFLLKEIDKCLPAGHKIYSILFIEIYKNITLLKKPPKF